MNKARIASIFAFLLLLLSLRFFFFYQTQPQYQDGQSISIKTTLLSEPQIVGSIQRFSANLGNKKIFIRAPLYPEFHYGDTIRIYGRVKVKSLNQKNKIMVMYFPKVEAVKEERNIFLAIASFVRQKTTSIFKLTLPPTYSSLLLGIVFGIKEEMPKSFLDNLRISGVMHVVAASGMNVTMVGGFLSSLFGFFLKRQIALIASVVGILFYALLAGLEPSIIRASIMGILVFVAQIMGRQNLALYGLSLACFAMLFISPQLIFDIGFQLSFLATLGLLYIRPMFDKDAKIKRFIKMSGVGEGGVTALSAQAATLPILLSNFGTYSLWSLLANGLVLWSIPILMVIGGLGAIAGFVSGFLSQIILYFSLPLLFYFEKIVNILADLKGVVSISTLPWQFSVGYYSLLLAIVIIIRKK